MQPTNHISLNRCPNTLQSDLNGLSKENVILISFTKVEYPKYNTRRDRPLPREELLRFAVPKVNNRSHLFMFRSETKSLFTLILSSSFIVVANASLTIK